MNCSVCNHENPEGARFCSGCGALLADSGASGAGLVGQVLGGRYKVLRVLGEGGMGVVYEAEQRMGEGTRSVAIKTLLPELTSDHTLVSRFHRESGTVAQLEHPNTIRFYDYGEAPDGVLYIVMELVKGEALTELIEQGPMPVERALHILRQVCGALHEAHMLGIVHRDLKPDNIVLTTRAGEDDFVKLLDFGIAAHVGPDAAARTKLTQQGMVLGTPPYMSPEQLAGEELGPASDIYSLGVIAYEMLTGQLPFEADTPWMWAHKHMTEPPRPMETFEAGQRVPETVRRAVMHALEKTPSQRPSSTLELYRELSGGNTTEDMPGAVRTEPGSDAGPHTSPMPALQVAAPAQTASPAFRTASALAAPVRPPQPRRRGRRGWLAAFLALVVAGGALAAGIFVFQHNATVTPATGGAGGSTQLAGSATTQIAPLLDSASSAPTPASAEPVVKQTSPPPPRRTPEKSEKPKKPGKPVESAPVPTIPPISLPAPTQSTSSPKPSPFPQITLPQLKLPTAKPLPRRPKPTPPKPAGPTGDAACAQAKSLASGGNIEGAVAMYNRCRSTGGSANALQAARARIQTSAPAAVRSRGFNGNCAGAKSAAAAASSIGAGGPARAQLAKTSCR